VGEPDFVVQVISGHPSDTTRASSEVLISAIAATITPKEQLTRFRDARHCGGNTTRYVYEANLSLPRAGVLAYTTTTEAKTTRASLFLRI
jgi:hypothetical protein